MTARSRPPVGSVSAPRAGSHDGARSSADAIAAIAAYVATPLRRSRAAREAAWLALFDALGCALAATRVPACMALAGPPVFGTDVPAGARVPGTHHVLDPVDAAFATSCMIRWLDFSDAWVALESGHPSDSTGALLAVCDHASRLARAAGRAPPTVGALLEALVRAYEIQGVLGLGNSLSRHGLDHAGLVRLACAAVCTGLLGGNREAVETAATLALLDGHPTRAYRQAPNTGSRKSWAGADAASRGVLLAWRAMRLGPEALTPREREAARYPVAGAAPLTLARPLGGYVMPRVLFKVSWPGVVHAQTALEAAIALHPQVAGRIGAIVRIDVETHATAIRTSAKTGRLHNAADRDHCLQYMVAVGLLLGRLEEADFTDAAAADPRIDALRDRMHVHERPAYTAAATDPGVRASPAAVTVHFRDGGATPRVAIRHPLGHPSRRRAGLPHLRAKLARNLAAALPAQRIRTLLDLFDRPAAAAGMAVDAFVDRFLP